MTSLSHTAVLDASASPCRLELRAITKRYPSVVANEDVSVRVLPGEVHAILGENGAGKSTLMKIIYGSVKPDSGEVWFNGQRVQVHNPAEARSLGISMVFQHFSLFETLTVAQNVWLGLDKSLSLEEVTEGVRSKAAAYGLDIDPLRPVHTLSVGEMQRVEIIRALLSEPQLLILDEPTSVLTPQAVEKLFVVLRKIASAGCSILYISHKLHEIRALCTACTVLRGGRVTGECDPREESNASLSKLMIGREPPALPTRSSLNGECILRVHGLSLPADDPFGVSLQNIQLRVHAGEVVGIAGISGNGQKELLSALCGEDLRADEDTIALSPATEADAASKTSGITSPIPIAKLSPNVRRKLGLYFVPEERLGRAAVPPMALARNVLLTRSEAVASKGWRGWISLSKLEEQAKSIISRFHVKAAGSHAQAQSLSGGNLQKFIVGREIDAAPRVLIVSQPTWGVDVGAAALIRAELLRLRDAGCAVLVVSEELDELFELSDRLYVMAEGRISPAIAREKASPALIGEWMSGLWTGGEDLDERLDKPMAKPSDKASSEPSDKHPLQRISENTPS